MASYATMARVQGGRVRTLAWDAGAGDAVTGARVPVPAHGATRDDDPPPTLRERWTWFREELAMMTFFLLDPESWR